MRRENGTTFYSPSDLSDFLACEHLTLARAARLRAARCERPPRLVDPTGRSDPAARVTSTRRRYLGELEREGRDVVDDRVRASTGTPPRRETEDAIRGGADVVYQACLVDGDWRGFADFLERQPDGCVRGRRHEARAAREAGAPLPALLLLVGRRRGSRAAPPERMHVVLGDGRRESLPARRLRRLLPAHPRPLSRRRRRSGSRHVPVPRRALRDLRLAGALRDGAGATTTTSSRSPASRASRSSGSPAPASRRSTELGECATGDASREDRSRRHARGAAPAGGAPAPPPAHAASTRRRSCRRRSGAGSPCCRRRPRATSTTTSRAIRSTTPDGSLEYLHGVAYRRRRRAALPRVLGARSRRGEARLRGARRLPGRAPARATPTCTSTTTRTTSARRSSA